MSAFNVVYDPRRVVADVRVGLAREASSARQQVLLAYALKKRLMAFENRAGRDFDVDHFVFDVDRGVTLPRAGRFSSLAGLVGAAPLSMPLGLMVGRPLRPFNRAFSLRSSATACFSTATSPYSSTSRASRSGRLSVERVEGGGT